MKYFSTFNFFFFAVLILTSCGQSNSKTEDYQELPVITLVAKDTVLIQDYVADIQAIRNVEIRNRVSGFLDKIFVDEGKRVTKGQPLFQINADEYKAVLATASANLQTAIAEARAAALEVSRVEILVEKKVISKTELEIAKAKMAAANAKIDEARSMESTASLRLTHTLIRSPFDGIVDRIPLKVGSLIPEGTLLTTISDVESVYAYFNVSESMYLQYMKSKLADHALNDDNVNLILADGSRYAHSGKIETSEVEFESSTGSIAFRAKFPNPEHLLKHGATGKVSLSSNISDVLMIPQKAVFEIQDKNYVFVVDKQNNVKMKSFLTKNRVSYYYIVESGLEPGEKIVYEGIQNIRDGSKIVPQYVPMDSLIAEMF